MYKWSAKKYGVDTCDEAEPSHMRRPVDPTEPFQAAPLGFTASSCHDTRGNAPVGTSMKPPFSRMEHDEKRCHNPTSSGN